MPDIKNTLNELLSYLYHIHEELELAKIGFDLEAAKFFVVKKDDPDHKIKSKVLTSTPNKYGEESKMVI